MKCETLDEGMPCRAEATHRVSGTLITPHACCEAHARGWLRTKNKDDDVILERLDDEKDSTVS